MVTLPRSEAPRVSIVIVTAKRGERLLGCLEAVAREAPASIPLEVVLVLNAAEGDVEAAARGVGGAHVISSDAPLGFAGGLNLGAGAARGDLLHVLHDDAVVAPGWLEPLVAALDHDSRAGVAGSTLLASDGRPASAGWILWRDGRTSPVLPGNDADPYEVDYCSSASLLVRRGLWAAMGGADENFHPAYPVDIDIAMNARAWGYTVVCAPRSRVRHDRTQSSRSARFRAFVYERNGARFIEKWADDLRHHVEYGESPDAVARAREATRRRAAAIKALPRASAPNAAVRPSRSTAAAPARERELNDAYIAHLEAAADELSERLAAAQHELATFHPRLLDANARNAELARALALVQLSRWWRLRDRIVKVPGIAALRRLNRRVTTSRMG